MGRNKPYSGKGRSQEEAMEVNTTHIDESTQPHHKAIPHLEYSRPQEKWKTKEHISPRNGYRYMKNEKQLNRTRKGGPRQSVLKNAGWRPMLHWEKQA
ncbi:unnamed protein product [Schistosoma curassoni]|uniref:Uncharacterized protein n=1 Tax=Schistosoma curassoni TaxID=6186 RepID=A0A183KFF7_9TREM|nr:unnamed protein product [Schistosoma curassoni]